MDKQRDQILGLEIACSAAAWQVYGKILVARMDSGRAVLISAHVVFLNED
jgi:hypothetical protein